MVTLYLLAKYLSITFPLGALGGVDDGYALGLELVADAVGLGEIPGLFGGRVSRKPSRSNVLPLESFGCSVPGQTRMSSVIVCVRS